MIINAKCWFVLCCLARYAEIQAERKWTTESVMSQQAVLHKHLDTVKWLSNHGILKERGGSNYWDTPILTAQAAANNHFEC
jgi:hypothetical protein